LELLRSSSSKKELLLVKPEQDGVDYQAKIKELVATIEDKSKEIETLNKTVARLTAT
jgi:hypothetical protein